MGSAEVYGFVAASFLILTLLANSSAACTCPWRYTDELWKEGCHSDFVVNGRFLGAVLGDPEWNWARYDFETIEVLKKPEYITEITALYTKLVGTTCGYRHARFDNKGYLVMGKMDGYRPVISVKRGKKK